MGSTGSGVGLAANTERSRDSAHAGQHRGQQTVPSWGWAASAAASARAATRVCILVGSLGPRVFFVFAAFRN